MELNRGSRQARSRPGQSTWQARQQGSQPSQASQTQAGPAQPGSPHLNHILIPYLNPLGSIVGLKSGEHVTEDISRLTKEGVDGLVRESSGTHLDPSKFWTEPGTVHRLRPPEPEPDFTDALEQLDADSDDDGLADGAELTTDPTLADTDGDGLPDGLELGNTGVIAAGTSDGGVAYVGTDASLGNAPADADAGATTTDVGPVALSLQVGADGTVSAAVSYTHLTLPTSDLV